MSTTSPNMALIIPEVGISVGPDWANQIVTYLALIDAHDHTSGKGVQIPTAGISINADLTFNSNGGSALKFIGFTDQVAKPATVRTTYTKAGELYYQDTAGNEVKLTNGGQINVNAGELTFKLLTAYPHSILVTESNNVLGVSTTAARALTLPLATTAMYVVVKDITGTAQTNNITITASGSDTIDGAAASTEVIESNNGSVGFVSDGISKWYLV